MVKAKLGTKRVCLSCGKRFYDMRRSPIVCPGCESPLEIKTSTRTRRQRSKMANLDAMPPDTSHELKDSKELTGGGEIVAIDNNDGAADLLEGDEKAAGNDDSVLELNDDNGDNIDEAIGSKGMTDIAED